MLTSLPYGVTLWLVGGIVGLLAYAMLRRPRGLPPGPRFRFPVVGHIPFMKKNILDSFKDLRKTYGDVFHIYLGQRYVVILNGYDVIKEAFLQHGDVFSDRPVMLAFPDFGNGLGILTSSGSIWKEHRKFALESLREFGFGKSMLQEKILEEVTHFLSSLEDESGQPFDIKIPIHTAVSNVTCNIVFGQRFQYDDARFHTYLKFLEAFFGRQILGLGLTFLRWLPGDITGYKAVKSGLDHIRKDLIGVSLKEHLENFQPGVVNDFMDAYIQEMKDKKTKGIPTAITEEHLWRTVLDLFMGGTETTGTAIRWALLYLLNYPHIQDRLYNELQEHVGSGRLPTLTDKDKLPYVNAFIMEVLRHADIAPLAAPHTTPQDTVFRGFHIPKGTMIFPNLDSVLRDPNVWKDPDIFRPERFLKDGNLAKPEQFIPFGIGRRVCLGESLAKMELFLFLAAMIQRFRFECGDTSSSPPEVKGVLGVTHFPRPYRLRAVRRL